MKTLSAFASVFCLFFVLVIGAPAHAQVKGATAGSDVLPNEAPVVVFNRTVAVLRAPFLGVPPQDRARRSQAALSELLDQPGEGKVTIQSEPQGSVILIDGEMALILVPGDIDPVRGETLATITKSAADQIAVVVAETRESRDRSFLLRSLGLAGLATAIFIALAGLTLRARRWLLRRLSGWLSARGDHIEVAGAPIVQTERLVLLAKWIAVGLSWAVIGLMLYRWSVYVLGRFPYTRPWSETLNSFLWGTAQHIGGGILGAIPDLLVALVIFLLARATNGLLTPYFDRVATRRDARGWLDADTVQPTRRIVSVAVWLFAIVMAYPYLPGAHSEAFKGMSVLIGIMVTVGGSSLFGQAASGLILMYSRTLRVGEYVRINEQEGTVTELGTFTTRIRTGLGEEVTLPNALVLGTVTKNYSRTVSGKGYVVDTVVTIGYDTPWRQVEAMLIQAARRTPGVLSQPAPRVFQTALSDFYPEYRLVCQALPTEPRPRAEVLADLHANIQDVFNEYGVQIMSPHYLGDPATAKTVPKDQWYAAPARPQQP